MSGMIATYLTVSQTSKGEYKEKGSTFIGLVYPVKDENGVKNILEEVKAEYYDARHHCYAYVLKPDKSIYRANDDGEPNHSAGDPILGQINSKDLTHTLVVVVRYFGGTKLGVGGLVNAYKTAAAVALGRNKIITIEITQLAEINYGYGATNEVMRLVDDFQLKIADQQFVEYCTMQVEVPVGNVKDLKSRVQLLKDIGSKVTLSWQH